MGVSETISKKLEMLFNIFTISGIHYHYLLTQCHILVIFFQHVSKVTNIIYVREGKVILEAVLGMPVKVIQYADIELNPKVILEKQSEIKQKEKQHKK